MDELNRNLPDAGDELAGEAEVEIQREPKLLDQVHQKFGFYGGISLTFGAGFTFWFYHTGMGINLLCFSALIIILLCMIMKKLSIPVKKETKLYYTGVMLLGTSSVFTSNEALLFMNLLGILFLLDLSLLHQFYDDRRWDFMKYISSMFGMILYSIASIGMPVIDGINYLKKTKYLKNDMLRNILLGIVISVPLLLIVIGLLSGADLVFGEFTGHIYQFIFSTNLFYICFMLIFGFFSCYCILCGALYKEASPKKKAFSKADPTIAVTVMFLLCLVYAFFCGIQIVYLFTDGVFVLPAQFTFAEYARKGFFELLAVTIINIGIMLLSDALFRSSKLLRLLVTFMTVCTYIMVASAAYRMFLYIGAYHLSFLRLLVLLALFIDIFVLAGVIINQYRRNFPLFKYCVLVISICYIAFSFARPDYHIAKYLVNHQEMLTEDDMNFLTRELSLDAAPAVLPILEHQEQGVKSDHTTGTYAITNQNVDFKGDYYQRINDAQKNNDTRGFNYSIYHASKEMEKYKK